MKLSKVLAFCCPLLLSTGTGFAHAAANPAGPPFEGNQRFALRKPTGLLIAGRLQSL